MNKLKRALRSSLLFHQKPPRKAHLYGVGTAKSGTSSIATIFGDQLKSAHEPESDRTIDLILSRAAAHIDEDAFCRYVHKRDRRLWLDVDSSQLNVFLLDILVEGFSDAKFILTIRNPYAWLDSFINHQLARGGSEKWIKFRDFRFRPDIYTHSQAEKILEEKQLYTLDGYLSYWAYHNQTVIHTVPRNRLLIVRTDKLSDYVEEIGRFAGLPISMLNQERSHANKAKKKFRLLDRLNQEYLESKVKKHCGELMAQFFPEIQSLDDALKNRGH
jgi:hypothetical protein